MNNTQKFLGSMLGVSQTDEKPSGIYGILQTKDYNDFIILSDTGEEIYKFSGAKLANKCLPGDHIYWNDKECELELRDEHPPIVGTIEVTNKSKYGLTSRGIPIYLFTPYNKQYPHFIVGCSEKDVSKNKIGIIKFDKWDTKTMYPRGQLQQILGNSGDFEAEKQALIWQASPWKYPKYSYNPTVKLESNRKQITAFTFNIDPVGCKDIDDVLSFEKQGDNWKVIITISDVAAYVEDGSAIDIMASLIGQTLYDSDGTVLRPMLPNEYSEKTCSLIAEKESLGISMEFMWIDNKDNKDNKIINIKWYESCLTNNKSYTYEEFQDSNSEFKEIIGAIASYLGNEDITDSHKWIEQMMILYNTEAGKLLKESKMGILRCHLEPDLERLSRYRQNIPDFEKLVFTSAKYCLAESTHTKHYGLSTDTYAHTSSPIRRYADLVNQRVLKLIIGQKKEGYIVPQTMFDMNLREKAIKAFRRDIEFLEAICKGQKTFEGIILEKVKKDEEYVKIKIYVPEWKRKISAIYKAISDTKVLSRDEKTEIDVSEYRKVKLQCTFNINSRNWKERVIINFME